MMCDLQKSREQLASEAAEKRQDALQEYAWNWFSYHAAQRTGMFNYSLIAAALFSAAFGASADKSAPIAGAVAIVGGLVALLFIRIDIRNRTLVNFGGNVLAALEKEMFDNQSTKSPITGLPAGIVTVDRLAYPQDARFMDRFKWGKHDVHLRLIQRILAITFLFGAITAFVFPKVIDRTEQSNKDAIAALVAESKASERNLRDLDAKIERLDSTIRGMQQAPPTSTPSPTTPPPDSTDNPKAKHSTAPRKH